jgi:ATP-dependent Clp protease ATP-binding subunit ClpC
MALALIASGPNNVTKLLGIMGCDLKLVSDCLAQNLKSSLPKRRLKSVNHSAVVLSERAKEINKVAAECCELMGDPAIGTHHVFLALLKSDPGVAGVMLGHNMSFSKFRAAARENIAAEKFTDVKQTEKMEKVPDGSSREPVPPEEPKKPQGVTEKEILLKYCRNLTEMASKGKLDPVIGRKKEIDRLILTLGRRKKNNAILVGEPGVGKTAIVEGFAARMISGMVPKNMRGKQVFQLNMTAVVGKTTYRGQFEDRMKTILDIFLANRNYILFVDEIHTLIGAGSSIGGLDAANIMKPALANGEIRCIGATTDDEYRRYFKKDGALDRRFQRVFVDEPTKAEAKKILSGIKDIMESHHGCVVTYEAVELAVELSVRYIHDRHLPDKAIDCLDEACASAMFRAADGEKPMIGKPDIIAAIAVQTDMPEDIVGTTEAGKMRKFKEFLLSKVVGQDSAIGEVYRALLGAYSGVRDPRRPIGCFVFGGPPGSGTTHMAEKIAEALFDSPSSLVRVNLSEFSESYGSTRLIGSPAGYVGYGDKNMLTDKVARKPYCLVLLEGIENANSEVIKLLTQPMLTGIMTDAMGKDVSFRNTIIIMTMEFSPSRKQSRIGFGDDTAEQDAKREALVGACRKRFDDEFVSRVDEFVVFSELSEDGLRRLASMKLAELGERLKTAGVSLTVDETTVSTLVNLAGGKAKGANGIDRFVRKNVEAMVSEVLSGFTDKIDSIVIDGKDGVLSCSPCAVVIPAEGT